jgi:uncharacterized protein
MNIRMDSGSLSLIEKGHDFARYKAVLAKPGILDYGDHKELLTAEELFHQDSVRSFNGLPFTIEHPDQGVGSKNWKEHTVGVVVNPIEENGKLVSELLVYDKSAQDKIDTGELSEISIARYSEVLPVTGNGYSAVQTKIRGNHVALTRSGRAGESVRIVNRIDSNLGEKRMTYRSDSDGKDYEIPEAVSKDLETLKAKLKEMQETLSKELEAKKFLEKKFSELGQGTENPEKENLLKQITELEGKIKLVSSETDGWRKRFEELEKSIPEKVANASTERVQVVEQAKALLGDSVDYTKMDVAKIQDEVIAKILPYPDGLKMDSISSEMRTAHYHAAIRLAKKQVEIDPSLGKGQIKQDSGEDFRKSMYGKKQGA